VIFHRFSCSSSLKFFFYFILCVFTFLFYKHLLLFFLLPRFLSSSSHSFSYLTAFNFGFLLFLQCRFCLHLALQKKFFLFIICVMLEYLYVWLSSCFLKIYSVVFYLKYKFLQRKTFLWIFYFFFCF
jgi:hypothetical protein